MSNLVKNISWVTLGDIANKGAGFLVTIYFARVLDTNSYGLITTGLAILGYASWIADMGLNNIGTREIAKSQERREYQFYEILSTRLIIGILVLALSYVLTPFLQVTDSELAFIQILLLIIIPHVLRIDWYFNGKEEFDKVAISNTIGKVFFLILAFTYVTSSADIILVPYIYIANNVISLLVFTLYFVRIKDNEHFSIQALKPNSELVKKGLHVGFGGFFAQTVQLLPPLVIGFVLSFEQAGYYGAAFKVIMTVMIIDKTFVTLLIPSLAKQWSENKEVARDHIAQGYRSLLFFGFGFSLCIAVFSVQIIDFLFGPKFGYSASLLQILSLFIAGTFINSLFSFGLIAIDKDKAYLSSTFKGGIFATILIYGSSYLQSAEWIAISVVIAEFAIMMFSLFAFQKEVKLNFFFPMIIVLIIARLSFYLSTYLTFHWAITGIVSLAFFTLCMILTRQLRISDMQWLKQRVKP